MPHRSSSQLLSLIALGFILVLFAQAMLGLPYRPRMTAPLGNYWAVAILAVLTPLLLFLVARTTQRKWIRQTCQVTVGLLAFPCLFVSGCAVLEAPRPSETDEAYELLAEERAERVSYRLYRTNCGATCSFGLELREELDLPLGVKLVTPKWSLYRADKGTVKVEGSSIIIVNGDDVLGRVAR